MVKHLLLLLSCLIASQSWAASSPTDMKNCFRGPFKSYAAWTDMLSSKKPNFNQKGFARMFPEERFNRLQQQLDCFDFTYEVDGFTVEGYYLAPKERNEHTPVVIYNRGGNAQYGYVHFSQKIMLPAELAQAGYIVIGSQYRGGSRNIANNGADEFGGADVNDVVALIDVASELQGADTSKIALVGWSRGVMQSFLAATSMTNVKAIVGIAGVADLDKRLSWRPEMENVYRARIPDYDTQKADALAARSVIHWLDKLPSAPILLVHGTADKRVNVEQSRTLSAALDEVGHPNKLVIYKKGDHKLMRHRKLLGQEVIHWLDANLK